MAEILKEWLTEKLNQPIKWEPQEFGELMKNGHIVARVLRSYHVIDEEKYFLLRDSNLPVDIHSNWNHLVEWLRELNIDLSDADLANIKEGKGSVLLRLYYQLFLTLDKRDRTDFIKRERKMVSSLVEKVNNKFKVDKVDENEEYAVDHLSRPLLNERQFIEWQKKKSREIKDTYDFIKHRYKKSLERIEESKIGSQYMAPKLNKMSSKDKRDMDKFALKYPCTFQNYTYEELLDLEESSVERKQSISNTEWAKNYIDNLYTRMHSKADSEEFQKQIRNVLSNSLWHLTVDEEESQLDTDLAKKVMKLSQFEKQMCTQIMETKQQARNLVKNRIDAEKEFAIQRDQQFAQYLDNLKEKLHLELMEIDFEKHRQEMLHQRLYAEKMRRKRLHYYEICYETMLALVDYATKYAYFTRLIGSDIPTHYIHEWKTLFFRKQPVFDIIEHMEDLLKEYPIEEEPEPEVEEILRLELDRQDALNDSEFIEYHNYSYPWTLDLLIPNYDPESEDRKYEYLGTRILGHVVYTLLEIKYPFSPLRPPANLPDFSAKGLIRGLPDKAITLTMQTLLNFSKVHVVRLEFAINYCLQSFKNEMLGIADIDVNYDKFINVATDEESKDFVRALKEDMDSNSSDLTISIPANTKQTQTPKTLPEEELVLSTAADLGKYAYEALNFGDSLTDHLLAAMLVEYIKSLNDINGFVIINYPNSYREAAILEETFSGREPPPEEDFGDRDDIYLEETIAKHRKIGKDPYHEIRKSRLVNDPHKKRIDKPFESYFTCYIKLKETEDILQEYVIWHCTLENSELIDRFYAVLGINYSMYFEVIDKDLLLQICKYIIGDLSTPLKSVESLFGPNVVSFLDFPLSDDKRTKSRIIKPEVSVIKSKEKVRRNMSKQSRSKDLEVVKAPDSHEELRDDPITISMDDEFEEEHYQKSESTADEMKVLAGEEDWEYGELPISENIGIALATCWEQIEKTYIHDLEQLFFSKRLQMNYLIPYARYMKDKMEQIITLPSFKQDLVSQFQKEYNDFEDDWRDVNLTKNEWHCRIKELQSRLYIICDERKIYAEQQRQALIMDNWVFEELTTMANTYISCMQTELNRSILTFQALHDFYYAMIKKVPSNDRLVSKDLTKINRESDETSGSRKGGEDKIFRQIKNNYLDLLMKDIQIDYSNNPFNMIIENNVKFAMKLIKETNDHYRSLISKEYSEIAKLVPANAKKKDENKDLSQESINQEENFKRNALICIDEWIMGINGEMYRANLRMMALQYKCYHDMKLFSDHIFKTFMEIQNDINIYYLNEINSVDRLCKYFQMATENGRKIQETLILEHDTFVIDPNLLQFASLEPILDAGEITELPNDLEFKICQLARLRTQFKIVAPTGIALLQAFIYLLQDFVFFGKESCEGPLVPESWKRIDPDQISKLVYLYFGETAYVDWRDFLIYCLNIRFPTVDELLDLRHKLRCKDPHSTELIGRDDFLKQELWFESDFNTEDPYLQLRRALIKHFLFELYETSEDVMNYSAFLLAFCKHIDPIRGFTSALSMAVGKKTCYSLEECEDVICKMIKLKQYNDECLACANKCTAQFLDTVITNVLDYCEGTTVTELPNQIDNKEKSKVKIKGSKGKKNESSRSIKDKASLGALSTSKTSRSRSEVTTTYEVNITYICKPCEEVPQDEKMIEKEEVEEEHKSEAYEEDPNLAYAVSQDVIWNVLRICLPWHFNLFPEEKMTPYVDMVQEVMRRLEVNHEKGDIYVAMFVADPNICKFLHKVRKFTAVSMIDEVRKICT